jgi:ATP phosphoribosyltransferase regulatory subunit
MTEQQKNALLPAGLRDVLPPDAAFEAEIVERLVASFAARGYDRIKPPLIEFEEGLLSGAGVALAPQTFRLMDPGSQRMMGVRADITPQIARIARSRLGTAPRPLRLSYAGEVLRVRGGQLRPERQIMQVGAELIGSAAPSADAEIIAMAVNALEGLGVEGVTVDLTAPRMVPAILVEHGIDGDRAQQLRAALDHKDPAAVGEIAGSATTVLTALLAATGPAEKALDALGAIELPDSAGQERSRIGEVVRLLQAAVPGIRITLDPVEHRGFEYHTGIGFTVFARGVPTELARGGRYRVPNSDGTGNGTDNGTDNGNGTGNRNGAAAGDVEGERATGVTLYVDTILGIVPLHGAIRRILVPLGTPDEAAASLRAGGWVTVAALEEAASLNNEAQRLACSHVLRDGGPEPV